VCRTELSQAFIDQLKQADVVGFSALLAKERIKRTLSDFVRSTVAPLLISIGDAWRSDELEVHHEHFVCPAARGASPPRTADFSSAYPARAVVPTLLHLRRLLPNQIQVWAGGAGLACMRKQPKGIVIFSTIDDAVVALEELAVGFANTSIANA
jgi:hypothetical protein